MQPSARRSPVLRATRGVLRLNLLVLAAVALGPRLAAVGGRHLEITPAFLEQHLFTGMTAAQVERVVGSRAWRDAPRLAEGAEHASGDVLVLLTESGLGSLFVEQPAISLQFGPDGLLADGDVEWILRCDERNVALRLRPLPR